MYVGKTYRIKRPTPVESIGYYLVEVRRENSNPNFQLFDFERFKYEKTEGDDIFLVATEPLFEDDISTVVKVNISLFEEFFEAIDNYLD